MTALELALSATTDAAPPAGLSDSACVLWYARAGQWEKAHDLCQQVRGNAGSWLHAHLHREEGDSANAAYWYARASKVMPASTVTISDEWLQIAEELI